MFSSLFVDSPEYVARKNRPFKAPTFTVSEIRDVVPKELFEKSTAKGLAYTAQDVVLLIVLYKLSTYIDPFVATLGPKYGLGPFTVWAVKWFLWGNYWHWQGLTFAAWWFIAHEAGHGTLVKPRLLNSIIGLITNTFTLTPYFSFRASHHAHHKVTNSMERDEAFVPRTRSHYGLPPEGIARISDYHEIFEETPIYTLGRLICMQVLGMQAYFLVNVLGSPRHPPGTNHFSPTSALFKPHQRMHIVITDIAIAIMVCLLYTYAKAYGSVAFFKDYFMPYTVANHWIVMLTFLQHSDPLVPHYREKEWSYVRGALCTIDRPFLGWMGRFFLHNVSHDHVAHHFFSNIPFYNLPKVTEHIKVVLGEHYNYDSTNSFRALYRSFKNCTFVEDTGDIVFYKDCSGVAYRELADAKKEE